MPLPDLVKIVRKNIIHQQRGAKADTVVNALPNGILCLKGGDLHTETRPFRNIVETTDINSFFAEEWFRQKYVIYLPVI
jgi:16S rRNA (guanine527-N7)-methyltransferase